MKDTATIKSRLNLRALVTETHDIDRSGKIRCPVHADLHPSCQVYDDHLYCYSCGWHADAITWLEVTRGLSAGQAIQEAERLAGTIPAAKPSPSRRRDAGPVTSAQACGTEPLPESVLKRHVKRVEATHRVPPALLGKGFAREHVAALMLAEADQDGDALFPILGPNGKLLNVKRRFARTRGQQRYVYEITGRGSPAWCSPGILDADKILVMEGELNAMISWIVRPDLGVMGPAGVNGCLHTRVLTGRTIYVYADNDEPGAKARDRWARVAHEAGALRVYEIEPWPDGDACDVAGLMSLEALRGRLS